MKVQLHRAESMHVQTFARELEPEEHDVARLLGHGDGRALYANLLEQSHEAFALVGLESAAHVPRTLAMIGVLRGGTGRLWLHMAPVFKTAGFGALRVARLLVDRLVGQYGALQIDIEASKPELVRMADWLGFKHVGFVNKFDRVFHQCVLRSAHRRVA